MYRPERQLPRTLILLPVVHDSTAASIPGHRQENRRARTGAQYHNRPRDRHAGARNRRHRRVPTSCEHRAGARRGVFRLGGLFKPVQRRREHVRVSRKRTRPKSCNSSPASTSILAATKPSKTNGKHRRTSRRVCASWVCPTKTRCRVTSSDAWSKFLGAHHRRLIGWDEILEGGIAPDATVMSWRGIDGALAAAAKGHDSVLSPSPTLYFDNRQSATDTQPGRET